MCYKIITNKVDINRDNFFTLNKLSTRGHEFKLRKDQRFTKQPRCQNFSIRCIDDWNSLPSQVIRAKSTNEFKNLLDMHLGVGIYRLDLSFSRNIYYIIILLYYLKSF